MLVLHSSMQREEVLEHTNGKCQVFTFPLQEEDVPDCMKGKCHLCAFWLVCKPF